jgi:hypothetical protein
MTKKIALFLIFIILLSFGYVLSAQEEQKDPTYIVTESVKVYEKPTKFSSVEVIEGGSFLVVNPYFEHESFKEVSQVIFEGGEVVEVIFEAKYIVIDELLNEDNLSTASSDDINQGENSTASTRGSRESVSGISFAFLDFESIEGMKDVNKMEGMSQRIKDDKWEEFRKNGSLGEFVELEF